MFIHSS